MIESSQIKYEVIERHSRGGKPITKTESNSPEEGRYRQQRINRIWSDTWAVELVALSLCVLCTLCMGIMLSMLDNKPLPPMPKGFTMNAVIAVLSTISKSSLLLTVSSCISQLKWKWYTKSRKLADTQLFEDASRGPFGAVQMLIQHRGTSTACIGALILILALLFEPFIQQVLIYPNRPVFRPSDSATTNRAQSFFTNLNNPWFPSRKPYSITSAVESGIWYDNFEPEPVCPLADCTWEPFWSLGLCASCGLAESQPSLTCASDLTFPSNAESNDSSIFAWSGQVKCDIESGSDLTGSVYINAVPNSIFYVSSAVNAAIASVRYTVTGPGYASFLSDTYKRKKRVDYAPNITIQGLENPLFAVEFVHLEMANSKLLITKAEECAINFCLREYNMSVTNGTPKVEVTNTRQGASFQPHWSLSGVLDWDGYCWAAEGASYTANTSGIMNGLDYTSCGENCFDADQENLSFCAYSSTFVDDWVGVLTDPILGNLTSTTDVVCNSTSTGQDSCVMRNLSMPTTPYMDSDDSKASNIYRIYDAGPSTILQNVVASITLLNMNTNTTVVKGKAGNLVAFVHVRWSWLSLPIVLIAAGIIFFAWTVYDTRRHGIPLWKGSIIALFFHNLEDVEVKDSGVSEKASDMEEMAARISVVLKRSAKGRTIFASGAELRDAQAEMLSTNLVICHHVLTQAGPGISTSTPKVMRRIAVDRILLYRADF